MNILKTIYLIVGLMISTYPDVTLEFLGAIRKGETAKVESLLRNNPDLLLAKPVSPLTFLQEAAQAGSFPIVKILLDSGMPVNEKNVFGWTALHFAGEKENPEVIQALLKAGADPEARSIDGKTPLNLASDAGKAKSVEILISQGAKPSPQAFPIFQESYFGQAKPESSAVPFALPWLAPRHNYYIRSVTFTPDGQEAYWPIIDTQDRGIRWIAGSTMRTGIWGAPQIASFSKKGYEDDVPCITPDGQRLLFVSSRPLTPDGTSDKENIWFVSREGTAWSEPKPLPATVNALGQIHQQITVDSRGNLYFSCESPQGQGSLDIYLSEYFGGAYQTPVNLGPAVNTSTGEFSPFISPDGSFLLFNRLAPDGYSLLLSFREQDNEWSGPVEITSDVFGLGPMNLGEPFVTRDGRYLIFFGSRERASLPFWAKASILDALRKK